MTTESDEVKSQGSRMTPESMVRVGVKFHYGSGVQWSKSESNFVMTLESRWSQSQFFRSLPVPVKNLPTTINSIRSQTNSTIISFLKFYGTGSRTNRSSYEFICSYLCKIHYQLIPYVETANLHIHTKCRSRTIRSILHENPDPDGFLK